MNLVSVSEHRHRAVYVVEEGRGGRGQNLARGRTRVRPPPSGTTLEKEVCVCCTKQHAHARPHQREQQQLVAEEEDNLWVPSTKLFSPDTHNDIFSLPLDCYGNFSSNFSSACVWKRRFSPSSVSCRYIKGGGLEQAWFLDGGCGDCGGCGGDDRSEIKKKELGAS